MSRVVSKHLFNFPLNGVLDEDVVEDGKKVDMAFIELAIKTNEMAMEQDLTYKHDPKSNLEFAELCRKFLDGLKMKLLTDNDTHPTFIKAKVGCIYVITAISAQIKFNFELIKTRESRYI